MRRSSFKVSERIRSCRIVFLYAVWFKHMWRPIDRDEAIQAIRRGDKVKITHHGCLKHRFRWQTIAITHPQMYAKHTEIQLELKRKKEV